MVLLCLVNLNFSDCCYIVFRAQAVRLFFWVALQVSVNRSSSWLMVYQGIQLRNNCNPMLKPDPANEIRWNGTIDETIRANIIMDDVSETGATLLSLLGEDHSMLSWAEVESNNVSRLY